MPEESGPPHGDEGLIRALRERQAGAVGYVYNIHGPTLIDYAEVLLGDHDLAVEVVRDTLVVCRDEPDAVPDPDRFRDWLHGRVRDECLLRLRPTIADEPGSGDEVAAAEESVAGDAAGEPVETPVKEGRIVFTEPLAETLTDPPGAKPGGFAPDEPRTVIGFAEKDWDGDPAEPPLSSNESGPGGSGGLRRLAREQRGTAAGAVIGAVAVVGLAAGVIVASSGGKEQPPIGAAAAPTNTPPPAQPSPSSPVVAAPSPSESASKKPEKKPTKKPKKEPAEKPSAMTRGRLSIDDSSCRGIGAGALGTCYVRLTASGGTVRWSVNSVTGIGVSASGSGTLSRGESTRVSVIVRPSPLCYAIGRGSGTIGFSPNGSASVIYTCWLP